MTSKSASCNIHAMLFLWSSKGCTSAEHPTCILRSLAAGYSRL